MRQIEPGTSAPALESLFSDALPARLRCLGVLDGSLGGVIWADDSRSPGWVVVTELADGTTYVGGEVDATNLEAVFGELTPASGDIVVGFSGMDDPLRAVLPPDPYRMGGAIDFTDRVPPADEDRLLAPPADTRVAEMDVTLFARTEWYQDSLVAFGSIDRWTDAGLGRCLMRDDEILCEATAGPAIRGTMEFGVLTREAHRGRGYATLTCRHLARACEQRGLIPWWNTSADNLASAKVARRLGFGRERHYDLVMYRADRFAPRGDLR